MNSPFPILWHSNAPFAPSGYGKQTKLFARRLHDLGHPLAVSAFYGLQGGILDWGGIDIYPKHLDGHGNDVLELHAQHFFGGKQTDGVVIALTDIWVLHEEILKRLNVAAWVPVDHEPCQPPTVRALKKGKCIPIAMSRFGERMLAAENLDPVYVPHGVETDVFKPLDRHAARAMLEVPQEAFLVGMVAANLSPRKCFPQAVQAFARFHEAHPEALLYLHTWLGHEHGGLDLRQLLTQYIPSEAIRICDQYSYAISMFPDEYLAHVYSAMDVYLNPAAGEGFGVGIIEAQACGTPVIVSDCTSMPELVGAGSTVGGVRQYTGFGSEQLLPDVDEIVAAIELEYARSADAQRATRAAAREFALGYDADKVTAEYWVPALAAIAERVEAPPPSAEEAEGAADSVAVA